MKTKILLLIFICWTILFSCTKYLEQTPNSALAVPTTLKDFQALLDNELMTVGSSPGLGDIGSDDIALDFPTWNSATLITRNTYVWAKDIFEGNQSLDWNIPYNVIYYSNIVIDSINSARQLNSQVQFNAIKGSALFYRAYSFYCLQETFGEPYNKTSAGTDLGIPLRLTSNLLDKSARASVQATFDQIIQDLQNAKDLLPVSVQSDNINRPCKPAVFAMLSRVYLILQDYQKAHDYADSCLKLYNTLLDFNTLNTSGLFSIPSYNTPEILFNRSQNAEGFFLVPGDSALVNSYDSNDLRHVVYFGSFFGPYKFRGMYGGGLFLFNGLATDEVYFIRAETAARLGDVSEALTDLNSVLSLRWKPGTFTSYSAPDADSALSLIITERRKELCFRGLRWSDLRRLNQDQRFAKTLTRNLNGTLYTLAPNDPRYTYPIPVQEINVSGIEQNER